MQLPQSRRARVSLAHAREKSLKYPPVSAVTSFQPDLDLAGLQVARTKNHPSGAGANTPRSEGRSGIPTSPATTLFAEWLGVGSQLAGRAHSLVTLL